MTALPRMPVLFATLLLAYLLPGLIGHDPWKTEDAIGIGIVHQMLDHGRWIVPYLAGEPYLEDGPFHYWIAALTAKLFGLVLAPHDGARLASGVMMAVMLAFVPLAGREFYGRTEGIGAVLTLLVCLGLLVHAHETLGDISMLAGQALAWYGIALATRRPHRAGWLLGAGLVVAALSKGLPAVVATITVALVAPVVSSAWRRREYLMSLVAALLMILVFCGGWLALAESRSGGLRWLGWFAMMTGFPPTIARNFAKLEPGHLPQFSWTVLAVALAFTLGWLWLILRGERSVFRSVSFWAAGITLLWGLAMSLILSWIDYGKSYRAVAQALKKNIPASTRCIESRGLGE